ncbi:hypothetical protein U1Q18_029499 [Sarracenia purpurea var. burkii]
MKAITAKSTHDSSFSFSRRYFHWKRKVEDEEHEEQILTFSSFSELCEEEEEMKPHELRIPSSMLPAKAPENKLSIKTVSKLRSALAILSKSRSQLYGGLGTRAVGTLFGHRRGHVHFAFQEEPKSSPAFLVELATPTSVLVKEMASGLVRIALECEKTTTEKKGRRRLLLEEHLWRTYCNGRKCGYAVRRECTATDWKVLEAVGPVSMGAGVLPATGGSDGEVMYMRAKFERVVGSRDTEAFYMMNPDGHGGPELSIYLLRV